MEYERKSSELVNLRNEAYQSIFNESDYKLPISLLYLNSGKGVVGWIITHSLKVRVEAFQPYPDRLVRTRHLQDLAAILPKSPIFLTRSASVKIEAFDYFVNITETTNQMTL